MGLFGELYYNEKQRPIIGQPVEDVKAFGQYFQQQHLENKKQSDFLRTELAKLQTLDKDKGILADQIATTENNLKEFVDTGVYTRANDAISREAISLVSNKPLTWALEDYQKNMMFEEDTTKKETSGFYIKEDADLARTQTKLYNSKPIQVDENGNALNRFVPRYAPKSVDVEAKVRQVSKDMKASSYDTDPAKYKANLLQQYPELEQYFKTTRVEELTEEQLSQVADYYVRNNDETKAYLDWKAGAQFDKKYGTTDENGEVRHLVTNMDLARDFNLKLTPDGKLSIPGATDLNIPEGLSQDTVGKIWQELYKEKEIQGVKDFNSMFAFKKITKNIFADQLFVSRYKQMLKDSSDAIARLKNIDPNSYSSTLPNNIINGSTLATRYETINQLKGALPDLKEAADLSQKNVLSYIDGLTDGQLQDFYKNRNSYMSDGKINMNKLKTKYPNVTVKNQAELELHIQEANTNALALHKSTEELNNAERYLENAKIDTENLDMTGVFSKFKRGEYVLTMNDGSKYNFNSTNNRKEDLEYLLKNVHSIKDVNFLERIPPTSESTIDPGYMAVPQKLDNFKNQFLDVLKDNSKEINVEIPDRAFNKVINTNKESGVYKINETYNAHYENPVTLVNLKTLDGDTDFPSALRNKLKNLDKSTPENNTDLLGNISEHKITTIEGTGIGGGLGTVIEGKYKVSDGEYIDFQIPVEVNMDKEHTLNNLMETLLVAENTDAADQTVNQRDAEYAKRSIGTILIGEELNNSNLKYIPGEKTIKLGATDHYLKVEGKQTEGGINYLQASFVDANGNKLTDSQLDNYNTVFGIRQGTTFQNYDGLIRAVGRGYAELNKSFLTR